ncbi:MAG: hypothetical protein HY675_14915 [Chloroflexi bacterium]|nr:hypothetical protein [Chloroflexota bacterium]
MIEDSAAPILDQDGNILGAILVFRDATERRRAQAERERLLVELERRATELAAANQELEAFAYSVSHDLKAPLRTVDGFSQMLLEDYADRLDDQGKEYVHIVRQGSQRMAQLIDDLLSLSRINRSEMIRQQVDLSELAQRAAIDLKRSQPERRVEFAIAPGLLVDGDARLLRVALENLLGNAWKFTSHHRTATIQLGKEDRQGQAVYYIRDDGAGFDPAFAGKLFSAFKRLHNDDEFPGNGIGLATVQRIIHRHGGQIWAEGAVERGATFYFTIPTIP